MGIGGRRSLWSRPVDTIVARKSWRTLEPYHGFVYFAPEAHTSYAELGLHGTDGYFASRAAPMGAVSAEVVIATFFNFHPERVRRAIPSAWEVASPSQLVDARLAAVDMGLRRMLDGQLASNEMVRAATLAREAAEPCPTHGRPLYAGCAGMPWVDDSHLVLWQAITRLREFRGDGHIAALVDAELEGIDALVMHAASRDVTRSVLQSSRGWSDDEWETSVDKLRSRGLVDADGSFTEAGAAQRQHIEDRTDALAMQPWNTLGEERCAELRHLVAPWSKAIVGSGTFGFRSDEGERTTSQ